MASANQIGRRPEPTGEQAAIEVSYTEPAPTVCSGDLPGFSSPASQVLTHRRTG